MVGVGWSKPQVPEYPTSLATSYGGRGIAGSVVLKCFPHSLSVSPSFPPSSVIFYDWFVASVFFFKLINHSILMLLSLFLACILFAVAAQDSTSALMGAGYKMEE